jgi:hypothetical protein
MGKGTSIGVVYSGFCKNKNLKVLSKRLLGFSLSQKELYYVCSEDKYSWNYSSLPKKKRRHTNLPYFIFTYGLKVRKNFHFFS